MGYSPGVAAERDVILAELRRTAAENGGAPLGRVRFCRLTGITEYEITRHWAKFSDALVEAGLAPNNLVVRTSDEALMEALVGLIRQLGKVPTTAEIRVARTKDPSIPSTGTFERLGNKAARIAKLIAYCHAREGYDDVAAICTATQSRKREGDTTSDLPGQSSYGFVYLARDHGGVYKIGRTNLVDRRMAELGAKAPAELELIHYIKTDDPAGVEAYWHRRFESAGKRMRGEWFRLDRSDVAAFRRWRRIA